MKTAKMHPIKPKANLRCKKQHASCVTVDQFYVMMKEAEVKEKQSKKEIFELIGVLDNKLMNVDAKVNEANKRINHLKVSSIKRMDILEEKVNGINRRCLEIRNRVLVSCLDKEKHDGYARDRKSESRINESKSQSSRHRDKSFKAQEREREREKQREEQREKERSEQREKERAEQRAKERAEQRAKEREKQKEKEREKQREKQRAEQRAEQRAKQRAKEREEQREKQREEQREKEREEQRAKERDHRRDQESRRKIARESHESRERKSDIRMKPDSSCSPDNSSTINKSETGQDNDSLHEPLLVTGQGGLLPLTEIQLQALAKPDNCVKFIGKLALASYPEGYFLKKTNSFAVAVTSHQIDALYSIVSSKYKEIKRCGRPRPSQNLTKEVMTDVIRNRVNFFRSMNRHLMY
ncbi:RNA-binding protein 25-like isoform X1 [Daphnia pulex]|uniref:RNA-binding protein 25-like isoform X1 n=1 Tax=Daphnia pulex TaxID=6669 RepID=UPI001EDEEE21|nr:RNA-binding protein 25-like isoform X1 [Daphnia pulex]